MSDPREQLPIEQQGRPPIPHFALGRSQIMGQTPMDTSLTINHNNDNRSVLPSVSTAAAEYHTPQDLKAATEALRQRFLESVKTAAKTANTTAASTTAKLDPADAERLAKKSVRWADEGVAPANALPGDSDRVIEQFTSPGTILNQHEELLFENKFEPTRVLQSEHSKQFKQDFRRYHEKLREAEAQRENVALAESDKLRTNNYNSVLPPRGGDSAPSTAEQAQNTITNNWLLDAHENDRLNKPRITYQLIDSNNRDKKLYPNPNNYVIELGRRFSHVKRIKLISTEVPNTSTLIRDDPRELITKPQQLITRSGQTLNDSNKHMYWINEEDAIIANNVLGGSPYDGTIYDASITPGNYVSMLCDCVGEILLSTEMQTVAAGINRFLQGTPHQFQVTINPQTNVVSLLSLQSQLLSVNPITTINGSNKVTIQQLQHGYVACQSQRITITGATDVGGIPASVLNDSHQIIEVPDPDHFVIRVTTLANQTTVGGGANVYAGVGSPFMLLASNIDTPFSSILGFPQQDSSEQIANPINFINASPPDLRTTDPMLVCAPNTQACGAPSCCTSTVACAPGVLPAWICSTDHGLAVGDQILINDTSTIPPINGLQTVTGVINANTFEIGQPIKVVNNQVTTNETVLGCVVQSLDNTLSQITKLTLPQRGVICTQYPHELGLLPPDNTVWIGNVIGGLNGAGADLNGIQTVTSITGTDCFNVADGILFAGTQSDGAFIVKTTSTHKVPINTIEPANNGRFTPVSTIFTGVDTPEFVLFRNTNTVPDLNGDVSVDLDIIGDCASFVVKSTSTLIWQTFIPTVTDTTSKLVGVYVRIGGGTVSDIAVMSLFVGDAAVDITVIDPSGPNYLGTGGNAFVNRDVCIGAHFCMPNVPLTAGQKYTWTIQLSSRPDQTAGMCFGDALTNPYADGQSDLGAGLNYEFRTFMSPGVQNIDYYSQSTGRFTLDTVVTSVINQNPNQAFIRSIDGNIRCIQDAFAASNGIWTFSESHGLAAGDEIFVNIVPTSGGGVIGLGTTEPVVSPNVVGIITVQNVIDSTRISTATAITTSNYTATGSNFTIEAVKTFANTPKSIVNIYPQSTGYLCKPSSSCDASRLDCVICPGDKVIIRGGAGNSAPSFFTDLLQYDSSDTLLGNVFGCYTLDKVFNNVSTVCDSIFDLAIDGRIELPMSATPQNLGEITRLDTTGGVDGRNGVFGVARVFFKSELCSVGVDAVAKSDVRFTMLPEFMYANACLSTSPATVNRPASVLPLDPFRPTAPLSGVLRVSWPNHGRANAGVNSFFCLSRLVAAPSGEVNPPTTIQQIGVGGWSIFNVNTLQLTGYSGLGNVNFGGSTVVATPVSNPVANPNPSMHWKINTPGTNYFIWYEMEFPTATSKGTKPSGAIVTGRTGIPLSATTGIVLNVFDTVFDVALKTKTAIDAVAPTSIVTPITINGDTITIQNTAFGTSIPHCFDGTPSPSLIAVTNIQSGGIASTTATEYINSLSVQSFQPHLLNAGDAVYIIDPSLYTCGGNISGNTCVGGVCDITDAVFRDVSGNVLPTPSQNVNNIIGFVVPDATDASVFQIFGLPVVSGISTIPTPCQTPLLPGITPILDKQIYYHKICGTGFTPISKFYPKSYGGMIESLGHGLTGNVNSVYIGQTMTTPSINGCQNACVIDENFWAISGNIISVAATDGQGQYVETVNTSACGSNCTPLTVFSIAPANTGVIVSPNDFQGNECIYFLNDTNINIGSSNELRGNFFTVTAIDSTQFGINVPIQTIGTVFGNATSKQISACQTQIFDRPLVDPSTGDALPYCIIAQSSLYEVQLSGAGGGNGLNYTNPSVYAGLGGRGGRVVGVISVNVGDPMYIFVGGAGQNGKFNQDSIGGVNGGGSSQSGGGATGNGSGGGATDIRIGGTALANRIVVAGGGGGGTGSFPALDPLFTNPATAQAQIQLGYNGGDGGGSFANPNGTDGAGNVLLPQYDASGKGGTSISGGAGGYENALAMLNSATSGMLGVGGGGNMTMIPIGHQAGGGGGYYGGGAGFVFSGDVSFIGEGAGGGGSALVPVGCDGVTGGGSAAATDGYVIVRPLNVAQFTTPGVDTFQVPTNAVDVTITVYGGYGGTGGAGPLIAGAPGGVGGVLRSQFYVGGTSEIQPGSVLQLQIGGAGANGPAFNDPIASQAIGGFGGGGNGPIKANAISTRGVSGGGGGATMVRLPNNALLIAAGGGGGGGGGGPYFINAGNGGNIGNGDDAPNQIGSGATTNAGGVTGGTALQGGNATGDEYTTGGGGGGGLFGGGFGSVILDAGGNAAFGTYGGGGGSGFLTSDGETYNVSSVSTTEAPLGFGAIVISWNVESPPQLPMGHYIQVPCLTSCDPCNAQTNILSLIEECTNGVMTSGEENGFPVCAANGEMNCGITSGNGVCIFITDGDYSSGDGNNTLLGEKIAYACPFQTPAPQFSTTKFETDIVITPFDIDPANGLGGNNVDDVSTDDLRYPDLKGLGWILATECNINPITFIQADSNGTFSPVSPGLMVGDSIYIDSIHPTIPALSGVHVISYIDVGNVTPQFFELENVKLSFIDGPVADGNIWYFKTPAVAANTLVECLPIGKITDSCPTLLTVTNHGYPIGEFINLYIQDSVTNPSINSTEDITSNITGEPLSSHIVRNIIEGVFVRDSDTLELPLLDVFGNSLCDIQTLNDTYILTQPRGMFAEQILSTNCGCGQLTADPANNRTIVTTLTRTNIHANVAYPIISNVPKLNGSSVITIDTGAVPLTSIWNAGTKVTITGQILGSPYVNGVYKIFNVTATSFEVLSGAGIFSTGGTGGYVSGPAPPTVLGHGLLTGDQVKFGRTSVADKSTAPDDQMYTVTVLSPTEFTINQLIGQPEAIGPWCSNLVNAEIPNHGLVDGDIFFLYGADCVGGLLMTDLNTVHGEKRHNIPTQLEIETRKIVRVVDNNNIQFKTNYGAFPTVRTLGGGYQVCISARNHLYCQTVTGNIISCDDDKGCPTAPWPGPKLRNYGFNSTQTNLTCLGQLYQHFLNFSNDPYVLLTSTRLSTDDSNPVLNTGPVDNVYSKVQLTSEPGDVAYNSYVGGERIFYEPIARLDFIDFQWFRSDGKPYDFRGREHSFTLEIEEYQDRLRVANKSSRRGLSDAGAISQLGLVESTISKENPVQNLAGSFNPSQFAPAFSVTTNN